LIRLKARLKSDKLRYGELIYKDGRFFLGEKELELGEVEGCILLKLLRNRRKVVPLQLHEESISHRFEGHNKYIEEKDKA